MSGGTETSAREIDWITVSIYLGLVLIGWLMIYAVGSGENPNILAEGSRHRGQLIWIGISLFAGIVVLIIESRFYKTFAYIFFGIAILMLLGVLLGGTVIAGSKSWLVLGPIRIQPSEPAKAATCLALASYLGSYNVSLQDFRNQITALAIIGIPMFLILLQGDAGSALVFSSLLIVLYREGMPPPLYIFGTAVTLLSIVALMFEIISVYMGMAILGTGLLMAQAGNNRLFLAYLALVVGSVFLAREGYIMETAIGLCVIFIGYWARRVIKTKKRQSLYALMIAMVVGGLYTTVVNYGFNEILQPHQQDRIKVWLKPSECDPLGALYNVTWSKLAIGSGGLAGKGFLNGTITKLDYVPEQATDFIFCTVGEEHGFVGSLALITLFLILLLRIVLIAERQRSRFTRVYAYGVASILFFHLLVNIGMTMGIMPVIGIPLPFISYGGSSLLAFTVLLGVLIRLDVDKAR
ncbi:MAG: rod shape-determining protein RodA [Saprospiraceae bacterium]